MQKEEQLLKKRLTELSNIAFSRGIVMFSDFLNLNELNILHTLPKNLLMTQYETFGGYVPSERQMVAFLPDALYYEYKYPMKVLEMKPLHTKFAEDLTHRDFLGAVLNTGIERCKLGDILVDKDVTYLFIHDMLAEYVIEHLTRIRHTSVRISIAETEQIHYTLRTQELTGTVPSIRLDCLISLAYNTSRSKLSLLIEAGKVYVNGRLITSNGYQLKEKDIISVRGLGKFSYEGILSETKKNRYFVKVCKYV